jgi:hypothetical protein
MDKRSKKCALTYQVVQHEKGIVVGTQLPNHGICDILFVGHGYKSREGFEWNFQGLDGISNKALNSMDVFNIWCTMAGHLADTLPEGPSKKLCTDFYASVLKSIEKAMNE